MDCPTNAFDVGIVSRIYKAFSRTKYE